jgi:hypothetical protein
MQGLNFIAIDFETATGKRASVCEAGICVVKDGKVVETKSWLVRPEDNAYSSQACQYAPSAQYRSFVYSLSFSGTMLHPIYRLGLSLRNIFSSSCLL